MNSRQIEHFIRAVELGSIGKAARALAISQPALTKSLQLLEDSLQTKLLERTTHGVRATVFGECLYEHAKRAEGEFVEARHQIDALRGAHKGNIAIGAIPLITKDILPAAIMRLLRTRPGVTISVTEKFSSELYGMFCKGDFEFIVAALEELPVEDGFVAKPLFYDELVIAFRPEHPLARRTRVAPKDLLAYSWIYPRSGQPHHRRLDEFFRANGLEPPMGVVDSGSMALTKTLLGHGNFIAAVSESLIQEEVGDRRLSILRLGFAGLRRPIGIAHRGLSKLSPIGKALIGELEKAGRPRNLPAR